MTLCMLCSFFDDPASTEIYTLSLHDALPILLTLTATPIPRTMGMALEGLRDLSVIATAPQRRLAIKTLDRKSTRLNSSHLGISYAVFCLKKKTTTRRRPPTAGYDRRTAPQQY